MNHRFESFNKAALVLFRANAASLLLAVATALSLVACEKAGYELAEEEEEKENNTASAEEASLTVVTRSGDEGEVSYPVNVYVMDDAGTCIALQRLDNESDKLQFSLNAGTYDVYAIAGADEESYELPTKDNATKTSEVKLRDDMEHGDLMTSSDNIVVGKDEKNTLTLAMNRKVSRIESVKIEGVPSHATAVEITLSPLVKSLRLDGTNSEETTAKTIKLNKTSTSGTWTNSNSHYITESTDNLTIKVAMTIDGSKSSYSCNYKGKVEANHKLTITGKYQDDAITLQGIMAGATWGEPVAIDFEIGNGDSNSSDDEKPSTGEDTQDGNVPSIGSVYDGCLVIRSVKNGSTTTLTLMGGKEECSLSYSKSKKGVDNALFQQAISECITNTMASLYSDSDLRLPTEEEVKYLAENVDEINDSINKLIAAGVFDILNVPLKVGTINCGYYYRADDGNIYVYTLKTNVIDKEPNPNRKSYRLRGFKTVEIKAK